MPAMVRSISLNTTVAESLLMNSGLNVFFTCRSIASPAGTELPKPTEACLAYCAPALEVITSTTLRKSAFRPRLSVSRA